MNKIPSMSGNNPGKKYFLSKKPVLLAVILSFIVIVISSTLYWVRGADEKNTILIQPAPKTAADPVISTTTQAKKPADDSTTKIVKAITVDTVLYNQYLTHVSNGDSSGGWPVKSAFPKAGALLPFKRIVAFYGNLYSKKMGILGELPPKEMLKKLQGEVEKWQLADSTMEVIPALHYIATTAQMLPGKGGKYRLRMPFKQIDSVLAIAKQIDAIVFLDMQVGASTLEEEIPSLEKYLMMPNVHLGIDPEFSMKTGDAPGKAVGTFDASDINYASNYLVDLVVKYNIPPKILVVHRFTKGMLTNYKQISKRPEVQLVIDMDGWGQRARKINTYQQYVYKEPVQFTGFKLFYKNDTKAHSSMLTPEELLKLRPQPVYIQYQ